MIPITWVQKRQCELALRERNRELMAYKLSISEKFLIYGASSVAGVVALAVCLAFPPLMFVAGPLGGWYLYRTLSSDMRKIRGEIGPGMMDSEEHRHSNQKAIDAQEKRKQIELQKESNAVAEMERKARARMESIETQRLVTLRSSAGDFIDQCESPPEILLLEELIAIASLKPVDGALVGDGISLRAQQNIGRYRVDFLANDRLVVEVDGRQYHDNESTFYSDRERDQYLQLNGYRVIRLTAKQIFDSPASAAIMVLNLLSNHVGR